MTVTLVRHSHLCTTDDGGGTTTTAAAVTDGPYFLTRIILLHYFQSQRRGLVQVCAWEEDHLALITKKEEIKKFLKKGVSKLELKNEKIVDILSQLSLKCEKPTTCFDSKITAGKRQTFDRRR